MKLTIQLTDSTGNLFSGDVILRQVSRNQNVGDREKPPLDQKVAGKVMCSTAIERLWATQKFKAALSFHEVKDALAAR
jgi:hypothetical protein